MLIFENKPILYSLFVFTGSVIGITAKILQSIKSYGTKFKHPFMYSFVLFLSETTGILTYKYCFQKEDEESIPKEESITKLKPKLYIFTIPAIFDLFSSFFGMLSYENLPASITTMFDGGNTICVFLLSLFFLKNTHSQNNFIGVFLLIIGLFFISLSAINDKNRRFEHTETTSGLVQTIVGIICCIFCNIFTALHAITEEYIFKTRIIHPIKLIGFEGLFGTIFSFTLILIFSQIKFGKSIEFLCIKDKETGSLYIENFYIAIRQILEEKQIIFLVILLFFLFIIYNYCYITITKVTNATTNIVLYNLTALFIWIFFLIPIHKEENQEKIGILQCIGFLILILGVCVYNDVFTKTPVIDESEIKNLITETSQITDDSLVI
jgi:drug/metabolite transporter (DMT)-like permease